MKGKKLFGVNIQCFQVKSNQIIQAKKNHHLMINDDNDHDYIISFQSLAMAIFVVVCCCCVLANLPRKKNQNNIVMVSFLKLQTIKP